MLDNVGARCETLVAQACIRLDPIQLISLLQLARRAWVLAAVVVIVFALGEAQSG